LKKLPNCCGKKKSGTLSLASLRFGIGERRAVKVNTVNKWWVDPLNAGLKAGLGDASRRDAHKKWKIKSEKHAQKALAGPKVGGGLGRKLYRTNPRRIWGAEKGRLSSQSMRWWPRSGGRLL